MKDFWIIAGPCVIETEDLILNTAYNLKKIVEKTDFKFVFKSSFDKANRSSIKSYRGPGIEKGLKILEKVKNELDVLITTDCHECWQIDLCKEVVDIIQIPAYLSRQTDLLITAGKTGLNVNVKKGQFLAPWDIKNIIEKIQTTGNNKIFITERGTCFGYNRLVVDFTGIVHMKQYGYPIIFDATHSVQLPGGLDYCSGGQREMVPYLARAAVAVGVDGLFMEVHPEPQKGLCDAANMIDIDTFEKIIGEAISIKKAIQ